jgi:RNA 2',3'-cyclic 3'-phosphodiesterase
MRLFCGIEIPTGIKVRLGALTERLKPLAKLSWSPTENLHVTTKFIGEWPEERLQEMKRALASVPRQGPVEIAVRGLGWFPNERNPRVLFAGIFAGVGAAQGLAALAHDTEACVVQAGGPAEERAYNPHLTLARRRDPVPIDHLRKEVASIGSSDFGSFRAASFFLYLSKSGQYTKLEEFSLTT